MFESNMEPANKRKKIDNSQLKSSIKQGKNKKLKPTQNAKKTSSPSDSSGENLLHLAVKYNNPDVLNFLLSLKCDVNAVDSSGSTPLLLAASYNNLEAVRVLLDANVDVCTSDSASKSALQILMSNKKTVSAELVDKYLQRLSISNVDIQTKAAILVAANCSLKLVLSLKDAALMQAVLEGRDEIDWQESDETLKLAMESLDVDNVRVLLHHGRGADRRKMNFTVNLFQMTADQQNLIIFETFIRVLADLNIVDKHLGKILICIGFLGTEESVRILLQYNMDVYLKTQFGYHLVPEIFCNKNVDALQLLKNRNFDVNGQRWNGLTALHCIAAKDSTEKSRNMVQYLLDLGADPNVKSKDGDTPIMDGKAWRKMCLAKLLLQQGADVQTINKKRESVFDVANWKSIVNCILPQLAIVEAQGTPILKKIRDEINSQEKFQNAYAKYCKQVDSFKKYELSASVTLFALLTENIEKVAKLLDHEDETALIDKYCSKNKIHPYYNSMLKLKLQRVSNVHLARNNVAKLVSKYSRHAVDSDHLVVEKIFSLLGYRDIVVLSQY